MVCFICLFVHAEEDDNGDIIVYITDYGTKYHRERCGYLRSKHEITLREAASRGYRPCSICNPPIYNGAISEEPDQDILTKNRNNGSASSNKSKTTLGNQTSKSKSSPIVIILIVFGGIALFQGVLAFVFHIKATVTLKKQKAEEEQERQRGIARQTAIRNNMLISLRELHSSIPNEICSMFENYERILKKRYKLVVVLKRLKNEQAEVLNQHGASYQSGHFCSSEGGHYGDAYTVYYSTTGKCFHFNNCAYKKGAFLYSHILFPPNDKKPCTFCNPLPPLWLCQCASRQNQIERIEDYCTLLSDSNYYKAVQAFGSFSRFCNSEIEYDSQSNVVRFIPDKYERPL